MAGRGARTEVPATTALVCAQIRVRDLPRATRFLHALGLRTVTKWTMANGEDLAWEIDPTTRQMVELYYVPRNSPLYEPFRGRRRFDTPLLFSVRDLRTVLPRLRGLGGRIEVDFEEGDVRITFVRGPDKLLVEIVSWARSALRHHGEPPLRKLSLLAKMKSSRRRGVSRPRGPER